MATAASAVGLLANSAIAATGIRNERIYLFLHGLPPFFKLGNEDGFFQRWKLSEDK